MSWKAVGETTKEIGGALWSYFVAKVIVSVLTAVATTVIIWAFGGNIWWALGFGFCAFWLNFIPSIGSMLGGILPLPYMIYLFWDQWWMVLVVMAVLGIVQFVLGNIVEPLLMGKSLEISPLRSIVLVILAGLTLGPLGMMFILPCAAILRILARRIPGLRPLSDMINGPAQELIPNQPPPEGYPIPNVVPRAPQLEKLG